MPRKTCVLFPVLKMKGRKWTASPRTQNLLSASMAELSTLLLSSPDGSLLEVLFFPLILPCSLAFHCLIKFSDLPSCLCSYQLPVPFLASPPPTFSVYNNATRYICHLCIHPLIYLLTIWARPSLHKPLWNDSLSTISNEHSTSLPTLNVPSWTWHFDLSNLSLFPQISVFHKHHHLLSQTLPLKDLGSPSSSLK